MSTERHLFLRALYKLGLSTNPYEAMRSALANEVRTTSEALARKIAADHSNEE